PPSALGDLQPDFLAFELGSIEELDGALGLVGIDLDEGEAVEDADVVDSLVGQDGALAQSPAEVFLVNAAALATVDEELDRPRLRLLARVAAVAVALRASRVALTALAAISRLAPLALPPARTRRVLEPLLGRLPLPDRRV